MAATVSNAGFARADRPPLTVLGTTVAWTPSSNAKLVPDRQQLGDHGCRPTPTNSPTSVWFYGARTWLTWNTDSTWLGSKLYRDFLHPDPGTVLMGGLAVALSGRVIRCARRAEDFQTWLHKSAEIIWARYNEGTRLQELAAELDVHPIDLSRAFRRQFGVRPGDYLRRCRIERAMGRTPRSDRLARPSSYAQRVCRPVLLHSQLQARHRTHTGRIPQSGAATCSR